ncbi:RHS repeat-associated core domain-containing protein [Streptomyces althioticus]|uniref:RHS repeat-associated core domain-containing protein n=1 Tax=Streptomyces althioticus TaxID=83380 RepID=UPI0037A333D1
MVHAGTANAERTKLGSTWFHHTALGLASTTTNGADTGIIREPSGTLNSMTTGGKSSYYLTDATGNVLGLADDTGKRTHTYAYGPTGTPRGTITEAASQPFRYAGAYADPTGLYKMGHRYYDPTLGRFTQPDPSGQETNPYLYADGDPVNKTDPTGLGALDWLGMAGDVAQGAIHLAQGDTRALWGDVAGFVAGAATLAVCESIMIGGAPATAGASAVYGQAVCWSASWGASTLAGNLVGG